MIAPRRRRTVLFVPAANQRALAKSAGLPADVLIFDLEDSAGPDEKDAARERLRDHLTGLPPGGPERVVRINPLESPHGTEDLLMARAVFPDAILLPKVESAGTLRDVSQALAETDPPRPLPLWAMIETPRGLLAAPEIAREGAGLSAPLEALVVGPNDLVATLGLRLSPGRPELVPYLSGVVLAARAHGLDALDGVFNRLDDDAALEAEALQARGLGFAGKTLIHPGQIAPTLRGFAPTPAEIAEARAIVAAFAEPDVAARGVVEVGGRMAERMHLDAARRLLEETAGPDAH
ncbi:MULTISPECIES: HpcH/HpaI aldolase/citrate lyase family protein [unclassified Aureimonas]|uniref:HpcH/HpaI aldolase/citrate lyase family protein n=1 Tax=unclassified Aureimonas TaxID=2615206 RepID=UPI0006FEB64D|nr:MULTISPECIES: CoA ester lyase [unclassified Aureimonas]KQT65781.1 ATP-binding protein [Aureimonas sp. Leaf427]KQT74780.1 ATP-binding protein [Aureimonas sp. Leaf460]